jgi:hypothetical protein
MFSRFYRRPFLAGLVAVAVPLPVVLVTELVLPWLYPPAQAEGRTTGRSNRGK